MELTGSAITALFVGLVWTLIKVVEHFLARRNGKKSGLSEGQCQQLNEIHTKLKCLGDIEKILDLVEEKVKHLDDLHSVYDENRVPKWYVSSEILPIIRKIHNSLEIMGKEVEEDLADVKGGQSMLTQKILDLLTAQKLMVERLGDIIIKLNTPSD